MPFLPFKRAALALVLGAALGGGGFVALANPPPGPGFAPDPPGHASRTQWVFEVVSRDGKPSIESARAATLEQPAETARVMGRFAIELWVGPELLDRVRFNVPMMGDGPPEKSTRHPFPRPSFEHVTTHLRAQMADNPRAAYLTLVDRVSGETRRLAWPPEPDGRLAAWKPPPPDDGGGFPPKEGGAPLDPARADGGSPSPVRADAGPADASRD